MSDLIAESILKRAGLEWEEYIEQFQRFDPASRRVELAMADTYFDGVHVNRETATSLMRKRQLEDIDYLLKRAGR